jgi:hypothetical protein
MQNHYCFPKPNILLWILLILFLIFSQGIYAQKRIEIHVSPKGKSKNKGNFKSPLPDLAAALDKAKGLKLKNDKARNIEIIVHEGEYHLTKSLLISPDLSGLRIRGEGKVVLKGSRVLPKLDWKPYQNGIFTAKIESIEEISQLVVNDKVQVLARYPNYNEQGGHWQGHAADAIATERIAGWKNPIGAIVHAMHGYEWGDFHYKITGLKPDGSPILEGGHQNNRPAPMHPKYRMIENVLEELDSPGEWFLDQKSRFLYFFPEKNLDLNSARLEAVFLKNIIQIAGGFETPVRNVSIESLHIEHANRTIMEHYEPLLRSDWTIFSGGALFITGAENCLVQDCVFEGLGGNAIFLSGYNREISVNGNLIHDCGASGICFVGESAAVRSPSFQYNEFIPAAKMDTEFGPKAPFYPKNCIAANNLIYRTGRLEKQTAGIQIAMSMNITLLHNSIYEVPRAGINIGDGTWGGHLLAFNDVFDTVLESGDHGSFNSWGRDRYWHPDRRQLDSLSSVHPEWILLDAFQPTIIRNNRFRCDHGWDIDLDDGSSNYKIYNNLCLQGGLKLREGFYRTVENNVLVNNGFHPHVWFVNSGDIFRKNIVFMPHADILLNGWGKEVDFNLFADETALQKTKVKGVDAHSMAGNPLFRDAQNGDFSVLSGSKALQLGFVNFPMDSFGVQKSELKRLAKTPIIPALLLQNDATNANNPVQWLDYQVKTISTLGEQSAAGLGEMSGVLILEVPKETSTLLLKGDVIVGAEGDKISSFLDLQKAQQAVTWTKRINLLIIRNQLEMKILLDLEH